MANVDQPVAEHIVMETSANGAAIISDGTGRMPVLDPKKISAAADVGSRAVDVLVLTKDDEFLTTVKESARGLHNVIYANTLAQADEAVRKHKIGVAVIDAAMVGSNVEKLTLHLRAATPRLVAIVAGRRDDGEMLMDLINRGKVYRFLLKPVSPGRSRLAIEASVKHHLEAPDTAFAVVGKAAQLAPKPQPKAEPKPVSRPRPGPAPKAKEKRQQQPKPAAIAKAPASRKAASKRRVAISRPARVVPNRREALSPIDDRLGSAFAENDTSVVKKIVGIVRLMAKFIFSTIAALRSKADATTRPAAAGSGGSLLARLKTPGIAAAALIAVAAVAYWMFSGADESPAVEESLAGTASISEVDVVFDTTAPAGSGLGIEELLDEARLAAAAGQVVNPPGSNAIELYMAAIAAAPDDAVVAGEFTAIIEQALSMAESALLESRIDDASAALKRVEAATPENTRLPFLNAQLAQLQLRNHVDGARIAIRETRFEDARIALNNARLLAVTDTTEIDAVANELDAALSEQRVDDVLAKASARLDEGKLIAPSNDNARYYYELARSLDAQSAAARNGLTVVASKLVLRARAQIDDKNFDAADSLLADARRLYPSSSELAASAEALQTARDRQVQQRRAADRAAAEKAAAEKAAAEQAAAEKAAAEQAAAALTSDSMDSEQQAAVQEAPQEQVSLTARFLSSTPVPISSIQRTKYVAPKYPRAAQRRGISGWVDIVITVDIDGTIADITIRNSTPGDTFVASAIKAAEGWEFEPVIENGVAVRKRAAVRMMFAIE
jgi:TonB family protein